jgi:hypothetical protein
MSFDCQVFVEICDPRSSPTALFGAGNAAAVVMPSITCSYAVSRRKSVPSVAALLRMHILNWLDKLSLRYSVI